MSRASIVVALVAAASLSGCKNDYTFTGNELNFADEAAPTDYGSWLSADVAPDGNRLTMTYYDKIQGGIGFAVGVPLEDGSVQWRHEHVDGYPDETGLDRGDRGKYTSHKVAPDGRVFAAYNDVQNGGLKVGVRTGFTWHVEQVDVGSGLRPNAGTWNSLAVEENDGAVTVYVAHHDTGSGTLRVSRRIGDGDPVTDDAGNAIGFKGDWETVEAFKGTDFVTTDEEGNEVRRDASVGKYARIMMHEGTQYIAFYDEAQQTLNLLEGSFGSWSHTVVDDSGNVGRWPSMWTDGSELLIAYHDVENQDLKLATRAGGSWSFQTLDDGDYVGADTEIALIGGSPAIVYMDGHNNDMRIAKRSGNNWALDKLAGDNIAVGYHNELVQTVDGTWWALSYDYSNRTPFTTQVSAAAAE